MAINIYNELRINNTFVDVTLTLIDDDNNKKKIKAHKIILACHSDYFKNLFLFNCDNELTIRVPNVFVFYDLIISFYGNYSNIAKYPEWYYQLKIIECKNFLCIENDFSIIEKLDIPDEGFDLLLEIIYKIIGYNDESIRLINKYLPKKYDLSYLPNELIKKMIDTYNNDYTILTCSSNKIILWNALNEDYHIPLNNKNEISCITISHNHKFIVYVITRNIYIWDLEIQKLVDACQIDEFDNIYSINISHDDSNIVLIDKNGNVIIYNLIFNSMHKLTSKVYSIYTNIISYDNKYLIIGNANNKITVWNLDDGEYIACLSGHDDSIYTIALSFDNRFIISGSADGMIKKWDFYNKNNIVTLCKESLPIFNVLISYDNNYIISTTNNIKIWDLYNDTLLLTLNGHLNQISQIKLTKDNKYIISGCKDGYIKIWDLKNGDLIHSLSEHENWIDKIDIFNNQIFVSNSVDGKIIIWNILTGKIIKILNTFFTKYLKIFVHKNKNFMDKIVNNISDNQRNEIVN